eukprot:6165025-Alexandrium_andersonii.AAC.1
MLARFGAGGARGRAGSPRAKSPVAPGRPHSQAPGAAPTALRQGPGMPRATTCPPLVHATKRAAHEPRRRALRQFALRHPARARARLPAPSACSNCAL